MFDEVEWDWRMDTIYVWANDSVGQVLCTSTRGHCREHPGVAAGVGSVRLWCADDDFVDVLVVVVVVVVCVGCWPDGDEAVEFGEAGSSHLWTWSRVRIGLLLKILSNSFITAGVNLDTNWKKTHVPTCKLINLYMNMNGCEEIEH